MEYILSLLIWSPILSGVFILFYKKDNFLLDLYNILINFVIFLFSLFLLFNYNNNIPDFQFIEKVRWIPSFNINYFLGVDAISILLILLNTIIFLIVALYNSTLLIKKRN